MSVPFQLHLYFFVHTASNKALYLSEIGRMHAQFDDAESAVKFYRLASEAAVEEASPNEDKPILEVTEQLQILLANIYDTGYVS